MSSWEDGLAISFGFAELVGEEGVQLADLLLIAPCWIAAEMKGLIKCASPAGSRWEGGKKEIERGERERK